MAGIPLTEQRRSQLLETLLAQQTQQPQGIRSVGSLAARLGAQAIRQQQINKIQEEEKSSQQRLIDALNAGQPTSGQAVTLEDFEGGSGRQQVSIPGRKADPSARQEAIGNLPFEQRVAAAQLNALENPPVRDVRPNLQKEFEFAQSQGFEGTIADWVLLKKPRGTSIVNTLPAGANKGTQKLFEGIGTRADERIGQSVASVQEDASLDRVLLALGRGAQTGFGESILLDLKSAASTFLGTEFGPEAQEGEVIRALGNQLALRMRNPSSGLGLTGSTSNKDLIFLKESVVNLQKTEQGNRALIDNQKRLNKMKRDVVVEQQRIISANDNVVPADLDVKILKFVNQYQLFTPQEKKEMENIVAGKSVGDRIFPSDVETEEDKALLDEMLAR